jgi:hypothetical protein
MYRLKIQEKIAQIEAGDTTIDTAGASAKASAGASASTAPAARVADTVGALDDDNIEEDISDDFEEDLDEDDDDLADGGLLAGLTRSANAVRHSRPLAISPILPRLTARSLVPSLARMNGDTLASL